MATPDDRTPDDRTAVQMNGDSIREMEVASIRLFVEKHQSKLRGRVLDFGAGKPGTCRVPQPHRDLVVGTYVPIDIGDDLPNSKFDAVLCTQVLQYIEDPAECLRWMVGRLNVGGHLLLTYPTNWDEVEDVDLWRFTKAGMERLVTKAGLYVVDHVRRAEVVLSDFKFALGYGMLACKIPVRAVPDQEESSEILTERIRSRSPFIFLRYGDGMLECIYGLGAGRTCDGEMYSDDLGDKLLKAWREVIRGGDKTFVGDWMSASFTAHDHENRYVAQYADMVGDAQINWLHYETLLLMRNRGKVDKLRAFYRELCKDPRSKVLMAPQMMAPVAQMIGAQHFVTPMGGLHQQIDYWTERLVDAEFDVLLWGAGMASNVSVIECWKRHPERTYINLGSAFDPLFRGPSRRQQLDPTAARNVFRGML